MAYDFKISSTVLANGRTSYQAELLGLPNSKFTIGFRTMYLGDTGLYNTSLGSVNYDPKDYFSQYGFWAYFIYPTALAESKGSFYCLNTYDRAKFTFTFMQFAAHVPNGDFVLYFRSLLKLPLASEYFPKLSLHNERICYKNSNGSLSELENDTSTKALMDYLNPGLKDVENQELISAARFVHWAQNDPAHRQLQVDTAINHLQKNMKAYHKRFNLNGAPAKICAMICDIRHQGRSSNDRIALALNTGGDYEKAYKNLLSIGEVNYAGRINSLKTSIARLSSEGVFLKTYDAVKNDFK